MDIRVCVVFSFSVFFVVVCTIFICAVFLWAPEHFDNPPPKKTRSFEHDIILGERPPLSPSDDHLVAVGSCYAMGAYTVQPKTRF